MSVDDNGNCHMSIDDLKNVAFSKESSSDYVYHVKLFLIGDLKGLFQIVGRNGHDSSYCLWCKCRPKDWKNGHKESGACMDAEKWTTQKIHSQDLL